MRVEATERVGLLPLVTQLGNADSGFTPDCLASSLYFHSLPCTIDAVVFFLEAPADSRVVPFSLFQTVSCLLTFMCLMSNHRSLGSHEE